MAEPKRPKTTEELRQDILKCLGETLDYNVEICKLVGKKQASLEKLVMSMQNEIEQIKEEMDSLKRRLNNAPALR